MISQIAILFTGVVAIYLTQQPNEKLKRFACIFGLAGQPFWMYSAYNAEQLGILVLTLLYTFAWGKGLYEHWLKTLIKKCFGKFVNIFKSVETPTQLDDELVNDLKKVRKLGGVDEKIPFRNQFKPYNFFDNDKHNKAFNEIILDMENMLFDVKYTLGKMQHDKYVSVTDFTEQHEERVAKEKEYKNKRKELNLSYLPEFSDRHKEILVINNNEKFSTLTDIQLESVVSGMREEEILEEQRKELENTNNKTTNNFRSSKQIRGYHL